VPTRVSNKEVFQANTDRQGAEPLRKGFCWSFQSIFWAKMPSVSYAKLANQLDWLVTPVAENLSVY